MDVTTITGLAGGLFLLIIAMLSGGDLRVFLDFDSVLITIGGTLAAVVISYPLPKLLEIPKVLRVVFSHREYDLQHTSSVLVVMAEKARREGLLALEEEAEELEDEFLKHAIQLVIDGTEPEIIEEVLGTEIDAMLARHQGGREVFETMGALAPGFGMVGTLIGLIRMLGNLDNIDAIGPAMAVALITTLYGALIANLICVPIANKLGVMSREEVFLKELIVTGVLAIQKGENPRMLRQRLSTFLSRDLRYSEDVFSGQERRVEV